MNCYLSRNYKGLSSAGNKAKTDIEQIMKDLSFINVGLKQTTYRNKVLSFKVSDLESRHLSICRKLVLDLQLLVQFS